MPKYDYRCSACSAEYERREGFDAPATQPCQHCGGEARRVYRAPAIVFKGSGFYSTDSRGKASAAVGNGAAGNGHSGDDSVSDTASAETAPAATPAEPAQSHGDGDTHTHTHDD